MKKKRILFSQSLGGLLIDTKIKKKNAEIETESFEILSPAVSNVACGVLRV